ACSDPVLDIVDVASANSPLIDRTRAWWAINRRCTHVIARARVCWVVWWRGWRGRVRAGGRIGRRQRDGRGQRHRRDRASPHSPATQVTTADDDAGLDQRDEDGNDNEVAAWVTELDGIVVGVGIDVDSGLEPNRVF